MQLCSRDNSGHIGVGTHPGCLAIVYMEAYDFFQTGPHVLPRAPQGSPLTPTPQAYPQGLGPHGFPPDPFGPLGQTHQYESSPGLASGPGPPWFAP